MPRLPSLAGVVRCVALRRGAQRRDVLRNGAARCAASRSDAQRSGCGSALLRHLEGVEKTRPLLVGTWSDARWAVDFYRKAGYSLVPSATKDALLKKYWTIPQRQIDTSVVLSKRLPPAG